MNTTMYDMLIGKELKALLISWRFGSHTASRPPRQNPTPPLDCFHVIL